ncbi:SCNM1 protein, partial [Eolophus roseicapillus]|nr:SCNM1 protein [Eolophus roseicapilla]
MSFKREGDDPAQLGVLQKRRVADLLANYIPEEEALLLRSGRYACMVCAHRPVFDTLDVLSVHRAGKKHMSSKWGPAVGWGGLSRHVPPHPLCSVSGLHSVSSPQGSPAPLLARTRRIAQSALLKAAPYSSCCRKTGVEGSSSRAWMGPSATPMLPEPSQKEGEAVVTDTLKATPARTQQSRKRKASSALEQPKALSPERRQALEHYLRLRSAGWIRDLSGKWVKDENAEFDSDEEEPPVLLPA